MNDIDDVVAELLPSQRLPQCIYSCLAITSANEHNIPQ